MKKPIYVLVEVTYDWYRFQDNLFASNDPSECRKFATKLNNGRKYGYNRLDVFDYKECPVNINQDETPHYWIQCLTDK